MIRDFSRLSPLDIHISKRDEDPQEFANAVYKIRTIMGCIKGEGGIGILSTQGILQSMVQSMEHQEG